MSTSKQDYHRQLTELKGYCELRGFNVVHIIKSVVTGSASRSKREDLQELLAEAKKKRFGRVVITEVSRLGRKPKTIRNILNELHSLGISVVFKQLAVESLDDDLQETFISNLIISIYSEIAAEETRILSARIRSGLQHAKRKGRRLGRPEGTKEDKKHLMKKYKTLVKDLEAGISLRKCEAIHGISRTTICKVKKICLDA